MPELPELKRVPCRCGGKATLHLGDNIFVYCDECYIRTASFKTPEQAVEAWNYVMQEHTTKVTDTWRVAGSSEPNAWCPECEHRITRGCSYCPTCGVKLEWQ